MKRKPPFRIINAFIVTFLICNVVLSFENTPIGSNQDTTMIHFIDDFTNEDSNVEDWHIFLEEMAENGMDTEEYEEKLTELTNNPIDLNNANRETLESLPFLNDDQVENLSYYLYRYGPMISISEILLVDGMDTQTLRWLKPFVRIGEVEESPVTYPPMKKALKYGKQELRWAMGSILQEKKGFDKQSTGTERYAGDPIHASFRYGFNYKNQLQWGFVLEKDPGEKWWDNLKKRVDYCSVHVLIKDSKRMNTLLLGDYTVRFGQGLVCGNSFSLGKSTAGGSPEQSGSFLSRHFSSSEINFFRGAAIRLNLVPQSSVINKKFKANLTSFASYRSLDSNIENGVIHSITNTGLHRTIVETSNQNRLKQSVIGAHIQCKWTNVQAGITAIGWSFDATGLNTDSGDSEDMSEKKGGDVSADFRMSWQNVFAYGELACDMNGNTAMLTGISFKPNSKLNVSLLGRKYAPTYLALFSNAFAEGTSTKNEEGLYAYTSIQLSKRVYISGYFDVFRFPWLTYNVSAPSWGQEFASEINASFGRDKTLKLMLKAKTKEKNLNSSGYPIHPNQPYIKKQMRLQLAQKAPFTSLKTILYANEYISGHEKTVGLAMAQDIGYESRDNHLSVVLRAVFFQTDSWENRIYLWEKDLPGTFSMPMLYGQGSRMALFCKYKIKKMSLQVKIANSVQPGLEMIGDGLEQIIGNRRTEARFLFSWNF